MNSYGVMLEVFCKIPLVLWCKNTHKTPRAPRPPRVSADLRPSSLRLSMASGLRLSARVFFFISLPVCFFPLLCSACRKQTDTSYLQACQGSDQHAEQLIQKKIEDTQTTHVLAIYSITFTRKNRPTILVFL